MESFTDDRQRRGELPRLVVTRALPDELSRRIARGWDVWTNPFDRTLTADELIAAAERQRAEVLLVMAMDRIDAQVIERLPDAVRIIATLSVGHDHIDLDAARARGIAVVHTPDILSDAVSEIALMLMLCAARRAREGERMLYERTWQGWSPTQLLGRDVTGARLGVLGMGRIGRTIARRARTAFDMELHYHNRSRLAPGLEEGAIYHPDAEGLLAASDFLVLAAPSNPQTRGFLNRERLALLPRGAIVVNIARGDLVDDEALVAALQSGHVAAAGLDVFNGEPDIHPGYLDLPNVFLQPHQGSSTVGTRVRMGHMLLDAIEACSAGQSVPNRLV
ncbi:2-hydroxyacid dehydrogenase [Ruegeria marina]|uniref:Glyoxylate reductase n=1 Tax=Ruegeria marina TaxID=639004 RepID=A0A1G6TDN1_9RHOB|nr:D-glycerate dehydrogenase [Ruegeria marina]SDD27139.1 glyoxylate reductase [Ruegeria marina]